MTEPERTSEKDVHLDAAVESALAATVAQAVTVEGDAETPAGATPESGSDPEAAGATPEADAPLQLYLLRHADAGDPTAWTGDDAERPLSAKGKRQARLLGNLLSDLKLRPDAILTSPKLRAAQTAKIVGRALDVKPTAEERLGGSVELADLNGLLAGLPDARRVILVGHDPDFSAMASSLTGAAIDLRKGAIARIDLADSSAAADGGALRWLIPPSALPR